MWVGEPVRTTLWYAGRLTEGKLLRFKYTGYNSRSNGYWINRSTASESKTLILYHSYSFLGQNLEYIYTFGY